MLLRKLLFALIGLCWVCLARGECVDASLFGFSPDAGPAANAAAFQKALDGGHRHVRVSKQGTYRLDRTVYVDDDTTLEFAKGVVLSKAVVYAGLRGTDPSGGVVVVGWAWRFGDG